jgi:hypothetical protein
MTQIRAADVRLILRNHKTITFFTRLQTEYTTRASPISSISLQDPTSPLVVDHPLDNGLIIVLIFFNA